MNNQQPQQQQVQAQAPLPNTATTVKMPVGAFSKVPLDVIYAMNIADINDQMAIGGNDALVMPNQDMKEPGNFQQVYGGREALAYLFLQIIKTKDKMVILRALGSMLAMVIQTPTVNVINGGSAPVELTGVADAFLDRSLPAAHVFVTNFGKSSPVTKAELLPLMLGDADEFGSLVGFLFYCANKQLTESNRTAFYKNRFGALSAGLIDDPVIFSETGDKGYITDKLIHKMNRVLVWYAKPRAYMTTAAVKSLSSIHMGAHAAFASIFFLLEDFGLGQLHTVKLALRRYDWIPQVFPEYKSEIYAANRAQERVRSLPSEQRAFAKSIWGNLFVPHKKDEFPNLVKLCKYAIAKETESYKNLNYGDASTEIARRFDEEYNLRKAIETSKVTAE